MSIEFSIKCLAIVELFAQIKSIEFCRVNKQNADKFLSNPVAYFLHFKRSKFNIYSKLLVLIEQLVHAFCFRLKCVIFCVILFGGIGGGHAPLNSKHAMLELLDHTQMSNIYCPQASNTFEPVHIAFSKW